jgi:CRP-like cAMP-binding protein
MECSILRMSPLFNGLSDEEIGMIFRDVPHIIRKYKAGSLIAQSGEQVTSLKLVTKGVVKGEMVDYSGRVIKIEDIPAPGALASAFMFGSRNRYPVNVTATSDAELLIIEKEGFVKLLKKNDRVLINFLDMISNRSQFLSEKIKFLNFKTIKGKLAQFILQRAGKDRSSIVLEMKQDDLAEFFGVARPSVARALGEMEEQGLIVAKGKNIMVLDRSRLAEMTIDR